MSYILEALKKADRERTLGDVPDLETAHWGERRRRRTYRWVWVVVALLVVNGALLAVLLGRNDETGVQPQGATTGIADNLPVSPVPKTATAGMQSSRKIIQPREPVYVPPVVQSQAPVVQQAPAPAATTQPSYYAARPVTTAAPAVAPASPSGVPYWDDLPLEYRSSLTLPHIDVHVYDDDPARRFILVDLQKYREGETLESGAVVEEISEDNIQLYYQGTRFLMER
ncbi:MAG: general secretion pathway protein GspB [Pseudomonadota bacterium]